MFWLSLIVAVLVATVHLTGSGNFSDAISLEIAKGNGFAYLLIAGVAGVIGVLCRHLIRCEHYIRTGILLLAIPCLGIIVLTSPASNLHNNAFTFLVIGTLLWFTLMGAEYENSFITTGAIVCILVAPLVSLFGLGLSEKGFLFYTLVSANLLYYGHLRAPETPSKVRG
jgi:hypothetical protein